MYKVTARMGRDDLATDHFAVSASLRLCVKFGLLRPCDVLTALMVFYISVVD
jgi:hypothetical protein